MLVQGIYYANGVALAVDESFVLVVETSGMRILKHHLLGAKVRIHQQGLELLRTRPAHHVHLMHRLAQQRSLSTACQGFPMG